MVKHITPHFAYQLQFQSGELERVIRSKEEIKQFLLAMYGGRTDEGEVAWVADEGVNLDRVFRVRPSRLLNEEVCALGDLFFFACLRYGNSRN